MDGLDSMDLQEYPDLPGLERVESGYPALGWLLLLYGGFTAFYAIGTAYGLARYRQFLKPHEIGIATAVLVLMAWFLCRICLNWSWFQTSDEGLFLKSFLGRRLIIWDQIAWAKLGGASIWRWFQLRLGSGRSMKVRLEGLAGPSSANVLAASIYQHLRRTGKLEPGEPPRVTRRVWAEVPEEVPAKATWSTKPPGIWRLLIPGVPVALALLLFSGLPKSPLGLLFRSTFVLVVAIIAREFARQAGRRAYAVIVDEVGISASIPGGRAWTSWGDVTRAELIPGPVSALDIKSAHLKVHFCVPLLPGNIENERVILAAVRMLRQPPAAQALALPLLSLSDPEFWQGRYGQKQAQLVQEAYLRSLPPQVARKVGFARFAAVSIALIVTLGLAGTALLDYPAILCARLYGVPPDGYLIVTGGLTLAVPFMMLGFLPAFILGYLVGLRIARSHKEEYAKAMGFQKSSKGSKVFSSFILGASILSLGLYFVGYTKLTPAGISTRSVLMPYGATYAWNYVRSVEVDRRQVYSEGNWKTRRRYYIRFADNIKPWAVTDPTSISVFPRAELDDVLAYAAHMSGKRVVEIDLGD